MAPLGEGAAACLGEGALPVGPLKGAALAAAAAVEGRVEGEGLLGE